MSHTLRLHLGLRAHGSIESTIASQHKISLNESSKPHGTFAANPRALQAEYNMENNRKTPEWGAAIFSELCIITRPATESDLADFIKYAIALSRLHMQLARLATPVQNNRYSTSKL